LHCDGGGPLVCTGESLLDVRGFYASQKKTYYQVGITSWGIGCGESGLPGVYANVSEALCFIDFATKCALGEDINLYEINYCSNWFKEEYCNVKMEQDKNEAEFREVRRTKPFNKSQFNKVYKEKLSLAKLKKQYDDVINNCDWSSASIENVITSC